MKHDPSFNPRFYMTQAAPCPYLDGQLERKLFTGLHGEHAVGLNDILSQRGFRRSQDVLYRPACPSCAACISTRINVARFMPSRSQKRVLTRNRDLSRSINSAWATEEQYDLFQRYLNARHSTGGMADMDMFEFASMIEDTPVATRVLEYTLRDSAGRQRLIATCLSDILSDGLSMVYSFFDPEYALRSLGRYMILDHIKKAREFDLDYVYLGYWVKNSPKMTYKSDFSAIEYFNGSAWVSDKVFKQNGKYEANHAYF